MKLTPEGFAIIEDDLIGGWVEQNKLLDHDLSLIPKLLPHIPLGGYVVDIGANIGSHTYAYVKAVGVTGRVYAFEPCIESFRCLVHNCPTAVNINCALGEFTQTCGLQSNIGNKGATFVVEGIDTTIIPLDLFHFGRLDFMKMDCEGYEVSVLKGATYTISLHKPILLIEVNEPALERQKSSVKELFSMLMTLGYRWNNVYGSEFPIDYTQCDILCLPQSASPR